MTPPREPTSQDDIFGKIDALLDKRAGFAGPAHKRDDWDFPLLTDVVAEEGSELTLDLGETYPHGAPEARDTPEVVTAPMAPWSPEPEDHPAADPFPSPLPDWAGAPATQPPTPLAGGVGEAVTAQPVVDAPVASDPGQSPEPVLSQAMENRLIECLSEHEARMEARLRVIIREELERLLGRP